ncbi:peptidase S41 [Dokdonia sinensis]|uniref:Peptidase S41 n=1 Tax=Dokdonia sinensis TaxID=2479847 RepID=A0A3M0G328_9FLAO|nr:S41 family peptidase [Dokdonia sinensis]RMB56313.1 peptidase S41 [Dokdonia sinensis]
MKKLITLIVLIQLSYNGFSQTCDCKATLEWAKKVFEENDAGFSTIMNMQGKPQAYKIHNALFRQKVETIFDITKCASTIDEWMKFFRSGHLRFAVLPSIVNDTNIENQPNEDSKSEKKWEKIDFNLEEFNSYLLKKNTSDFEGVWVSGPYEIGIRKIGEEYIGFIIDPGTSNWQKGQVKLRIKKDRSAIYFMGDYSEERMENTQLWEADYLRIGFITLQRKSSLLSPNSLVAEYFKAIEATEPYFKKLDESTVYIRIPSFNPSEKVKIDSLLKIHHLDILNAQNFLIDIRNNSGGGDSSYEELIPYLYTNPIRKIGIEYLATEYNKKMWLDFANNKGFIKELYGGKDWPVEMQKECQGIYEKLAPYDGEFVSLDDSPVKENVIDNVYPFPKKIGILINGNVASTSEQFVLAARQSMKVKLFGTTTYGALDMSNLNYVKSPCGQFYINFASSRSKRLPENKIDDIGLQPDYYFDKTIKPYKWIDKTIEILNYK